MEENMCATELIEHARFLYTHRNESNNKQKCVKYARMAYEADNTFAYEFAMFAINFGSEFEKKQAVTILFTLAEKKDPLAMLSYANLQYHGHIVEKNTMSSNVLRKSSPLSYEIFLANSLFCINPELYSYKHVALYDQLDESGSILASCIQHNLFIEYLCTLVNTSKYEFVKKISCDDLQKIEDYALIINENSLQYLVENNGALYVYNELCPLIDKKHVKSLYVLNEKINKSDVVIVGDSYESWKLRVVLEYSGARVHDVYAIVDEQDINETILKSIIHEKTSIVITSIHWAKIYCAVLEIVKVKESIFVDFAPENYFHNVVYGTVSNLERYKLVELNKDYCKGKAFCELFSKDRDTHYVIADWSAVGDTIKLAALIKSYKQHNGYKKVCLVTTDRYVGLTKLFPDIDKQCTISWDEMKSIRFYFYLSTEYEYKNINFFGKRAYCGISNYSRTYCNSISYFDGFKELLGLPLYSRYAQSTVRPTKKNGKRILLNPYGFWFYANCSCGYDRINEIMCGLIKKLNYNGYECYTNCSADAPLPLNGSKSAKMDLIGGIYSCNEYRYVISIPTGFAEAIALTGCDMFILYPDEFFLNNLDYRDLNPSGTISSHFIKKHTNEMIIDEILKKILEGKKC